MALPSQTMRPQTWRAAAPKGGGSGVSGFLNGRNGQRNMILSAAVIMAVAAGFVWWRVARTPATVVADTGSKDTFLPSTPRTDATPPAPAPTPAPAPAVISMTEKPGKPSLDDLIAQASRQAAPEPGTKPATPIVNTPPTAPAGGGVQPAIMPKAPEPAAALAPAAATLGSSQGKRAIDQGEQLIRQNKLLEARTVLNDALMNPSVGAADRAAIRTSLGTVNETLFFSPRIEPGDMLTDSHDVKSGETLGRIVRRQGLPIDWRLLVRINHTSENALKIGQTIKIVRLPLHAVVHKSDYRMDIYAGPPATGSGNTGPDGQEPGWVYLRSFKVGLGESNGTPEGVFAVRSNSKLINPRWVNPRTGEVFEADNPKNPIGERWIGLEGVDDNTRSFTGYGIHGTIEPDSIGQQRSMGCVRMSSEDVEMVYEMLVDRMSTVKIIK